MEIFDMNLKRTVLHFQNSTSDKVYIIEVNQLTGPKPYVVVATWGKRDAPRLNSQIKDAFSALGTATAFADKLIFEKQRGKDAYRLAARELNIPGLNQISAIAAVQAGAVSNVTETKINEITEGPLRRKIKI